MGLDAHVRCNCAKEGKTRPFPFPGRLAFDECGEPFLLNNDGQVEEDLAKLMQFDRWESNQGCEHDRFLVNIRLGNISYVGHIREWIKAKETLTEQKFPVLLEKVVYSGSHCGDCISSSDAQRLFHELQLLSTFVENDFHREFTENMKQLCGASLASGNPIVF